MPYVRTTQPPMYWSCDPSHAYIRPSLFNFPTTDRYKHKHYNIKRSSLHILYRQNWFLTQDHSNYFRIAPAVGACVFLTARKPLVVLVNSVPMFKGIKIYFTDELRENESYIVFSEVIIDERSDELFSVVDKFSFVDSAYRM